MKKLTFYTMITVIMLIATPSIASAPCLENDPDYEGIRSWVYFQDNIDHPSNCAYAGNGCISCTAPAIK